MSGLLDDARRLLDETPSGTVSAWPRAAALLARQHLEAAIDAYWEQRAPEVRWISMRAQLACLRVYLGNAATAAEVAFTWHALSRATHHHPYELDPTREELASWIEQTDRLSTVLQAPSR